MVRLFNQTYSKRELEKYTGTLAQIGGVEKFVRVEGKESGVETLQVRTGAGLTFWITPSKGMDIARAELFGIPISWESCNGNVSPCYFESKKAEWLRTASGGLLMTCGLSQVGAYGEDGYGEYGLHGLMHHNPAKSVSVNQEWENEECRITISGIVEETTIMGSRLRLTRKIHIDLGENIIELEDTVENFGFVDAPHMMLYHFNFGFPLLNPETTIELPNCITKRSDGQSISGTPYLSFQKPTRNFSEEVFYHTLLNENKASVKVITPNFPINNENRLLETEISWDTVTLPKLVQWKLPNEGDYVLGIEPSNCWTKGRASEENLIKLAPEETINYKVTLKFKI